jgi:isocitrate/isopropylmalate dehydrogenase
MRIVVLPGDGIGPEITAATLDVLRVASEGFPASISLHSSPPGLTGDPVLRGAHGAHNPTGPITGCPACTG